MTNELFDHDHPHYSTHPNPIQVERVISDIKYNHHLYMMREMHDLKKWLYRLAENHAANSHAVQLAKLFDRFARDFTRHMDTEEQVLFPLIVAQLKGEARNLKPLISESVTEKLALEDRVVGSEFGKILALAQLLNERAVSAEFADVVVKLKEMEANLSEHTEKERRFVMPFVAEYLKYLLN